MPLVLASASPRRQELLKNAQMDVIVRPANIREVRRATETPNEFAERMAREKASAVWDSVVSPHLSNTARGGAPIVLGADTVVVAGNEILGKPVDASDAVRMLRMLSDREH